MQMNRVPQREQTSKRTQRAKKCLSVDFKQGDLTMTEKEAENYLLENWGDIIQESKTKKHINAGRVSEQNRCRQEIRNGVDRSLLALEIDLMQMNQ